MATPKARDAPLAEWVDAVMGLGSPSEWFAGATVRPSHFATIGHGHETVMGSWTDAPVGRMT
jgi:hypothetical protein